jgi:hypothetical protein
VAIWHIAKNEYKNAGIHRFEWIKKQRPPSYEKMQVVAFFLVTTGFFQTAAFQSVTGTHPNKKVHDIEYINPLKGENV